MPCGQSWFWPVELLVDTVKSEGFSSRNPSSVQSMPKSRATIHCLYEGSISGVFMRGLYQGSLSGVFIREFIAGRFRETDEYGVCPFCWDGPQTGWQGRLLGAVPERVRA